MKAMVLRQSGAIESNPLESVEIAQPQPGPSQVLIKVEACGLCHTDLHIVEGELDLPRLPLILGHQVVGTVEKLGPAVDRLAVGDRVGLAWLGWTCRKCDFCLTGRENLCEAARFTGYHFDGGYAQYVVAEVDFAYQVPRNISSVAAAPLLCAGIIGYRALRLSNITKGGRLGLYGFGASAHLAIQIARHWQCEVYVFSRSASHRKLAQKLGAVWTGQIHDKVPAKLQAAVIFAPAGEMVPAALDHLQKGGTLALAGIHMTDIPTLNYQKHLYYEKTLRSVTASTRADGRELMRLAGEIPLQTTTHEFALADANRALQMLKASQIDGAGVLRIA